ncbi:o-methyltransferase [Perkinsus chesapeaki]|uniref:O-methyltransferase n=1 Tax=Perkinsus chesapeaki TaxID=330153 RepID=A0A7J6L3C9_PERCH|nr:o-methyltransferase [Perkinsus chesapeaki]
MAYRKSLQLQLSASNFGGSLTDGHEPLNSVNFNDLAERDEVVGQGGLWKPRFCGWPIGGSTRKAALARCFMGLPGEQYTKKGKAKARLLASGNPTTASTGDLKNMNRILQDSDMANNVTLADGPSSPPLGCETEFKHDFDAVYRRPIRRHTSLPDMLYNNDINQHKPLLLGSYKMLSAGKVPLKTHDECCPHISSKRIRQQQQHQLKQMEEQNNKDAAAVIEDMPGITEGMSATQRAFYDTIAEKDESVMVGGSDEAQFFKLLMHSIGAKKALEVGVFRGSTTAYLAQGVGKGGKVIGLDINKDYLDEVNGEQYWADMGIADRIEIRVGDAVDSMRELYEGIDNAGNTFDFIFIDAHKPHYDAYYEWALKLAKPGTGIIAIDNTFFGGSVLDETDEKGKAIDALNKKILTDERVENCMLCICDGVSILRKRADGEELS